LCRRDEILNTFPDYYIVSLGVTDASTREIPLWYSNIINNNCVSNTKKVFTGLYGVLIKPLRPYLVRIRRYKTWTHVTEFRKYYNALIDFLLKGTNANILLLSINNTTERVELELPGSRENYMKYNQIIKEESTKQRVKYIDTWDLNPDIFLPDGIHYSLAGHEEISDRLLQSIVKLEEIR
jgi:lysophospholipase L1-like esterase